MSNINPLDPQLHADVAPNGKVKFTATRPNGQVTLEFVNDYVGPVATLLLATAVASHAEAEEKGERIDQLDPPFKCIPILPTNLIVTDSEREGHIVFGFLCGTAVVAFDLDLSDLDELPGVLMALRAEAEGKPH